MRALLSLINAPFAGNSCDLVTTVNTANAAIAFKRGVDNLWSQRYVPPHIESQLQGNQNLGS